MDKKPMVVIVAGGLATRMRPLTENIPKCMIDVNGKPLIQHQIEFFKEKGYKRFIFCIAHLAEKVKEYFGDGTRLGVHIEYSIEPKELMGTAGAVKLIEELVDDVFIIFYGDSITNMDFDEALRFHNDKKSDFTVVMREITEEYLAKKPDSVPDSAIITDKDDKIVAMLEKPTPEQYDPYRVQRGYINNGFYIMPKKILGYIPQDKKYDFAKDLIPDLIRRGLNVFGYLSDDYYVEIGKIHKYENFKKKVEGKDRIL